MANTITPGTFRWHRRSSSRSRNHVFLELDYINGISYFNNWTLLEHYWNIEHKTFEHWTFEHLIIWTFEHWNTLFCYWPQTVAKTMIKQRHVKKFKSLKAYNFLIKLGPGRTPAGWALVDRGESTVPVIKHLTPRSPTACRKGAIQNCYQQLAR